MDAQRTHAHNSLYPLFLHTLYLVTRFKALRKTEHKRCHVFEAVKKMKQRMDDEMEP